MLVLMRNRIAGSFGKPSGRSSEHLKAHSQSAGSLYLSLPLSAPKVSQHFTARFIFLKPGCDPLTPALTAYKVSPISSASLLLRPSVAPPRDLGRSYLAFLSFTHHCSSQRYSLAVPNRSGILFYIFFFFLFFPFVLLPPPSFSSSFSSPSFSSSFFKMGSHVVQAGPELLSFLTPKC